MRKHLTIIMTLGAVVLLTAAGCGTTTEAAQALKDTKLVLRSQASLDDLLHQRDALGHLPRTDFSKEDWATRLSLMRTTDQRIMDADIGKVDGLISQYRPQATTDAATLAAQAVANTRRTVKESFTEDLTNVTKDAVTSVACEKILDGLAPPERPSEPGEASTLEDATDEAFTKLALHWAPESIRTVVDWAFYVKSVGQAADRFATRIGGYSTTPIPNPNPVLLTTPQTPEAAVAYLRACYSPPRKPGGAT